MFRLCRITNTQLGNTNNILPNDQVGLAYSIKNAYCTVFFHFQALLND